MPLWHHSFSDTNRIVSHVRQLLPTLRAVIWKDCGKLKVNALVFGCAVGKASKIGEYSPTCMLVYKHLIIIMYSIMLLLLLSCCAEKSLTQIISVWHIILDNKSQLQRDGSIVHPLLHFHPFDNDHMRPTHILSIIK